MLSRDFRYFGATGSAEYKSSYPLMKEAVEGLRRGYLVNHQEALRQDLLNLKDWVWRSTKAQVAGSPSAPPSFVPSSCGRRPVSQRAKRSGCQGSRLPA